MKGISNATIRKLKSIQSKAEVVWIIKFNPFFIAIFAAWFMSREASRDELDIGDGLGYRTWRFLVRFIAPAAILIVFLNLIGVITFDS